MWLVSMLALPLSGMELHGFYPLVDIAAKGPADLDSIASSDISEHTGDFGNEWRLLRHNHPGGAYSYRGMPIFSFTMRSTHRPN